LRPVLIELLRRRTKVIVANGAAALVAKAVTTTVPIVFTTGFDPIRDGLVRSLSRPGGNITGVVFFVSVVGAKRLDFLRQLLPAGTTIAVLVKTNSSATEAERRDIETAAETVGQKLILIDLRSDHDMESAFEAFIRGGAGALLLGSGASLNEGRERIIALAQRNRLPTLYPVREFAERGGLISYGASIADAYRQAGIYAGRIIDGEMPAELPVIQSTKLQLVINIKTAHALGLTIPPTLLARADEVIE
jgi:putative ABC transport system substrate-binding protein